ncbi:hypothetical protein ABEB36_009482 [Hypothenemus hampei]|uniref:Uncharacterized protein n=1 Tax=Hypothenemus hampei TaxID=57062 RepID=A0ABD1EIN2_HYPHA
MNDNYEDNEENAIEQDKNGNDNENEQDREEVNDVQNEEENEDQAEMEAIPCSSKESLILTARKDAHYNLAKQAIRMKKTSDRSHPPLKVADNVTVPIPDVDKAKADLRNIIGVILEVTSAQLYKIGTRDGILDKLYCRKVGVRWLYREVYSPGRGAKNINHVKDCCKKICYWNWTRLFTMSLL